MNDPSEQTPISNLRAHGALITQRARERLRDSVSAHSQASRRNRSAAA